MHSILTLETSHTQGKGKSIKYLTLTMKNQSMHAYMLLAFVFKLAYCMNCVVSLSQWSNATRCRQFYMCMICQSFG